MVIAINCRNLTNTKLEGFGNYTYEITQRLIANNPKVSFILIYDRKRKHPFPYFPNCKEIIIPPATRHPILYWIWFELQLPRILRKEKVAVFFSPDGYNSLRNNIPSVITIHDLNFEHNPQDLPKVFRTYLKRNFIKFAHKAHKIITVSHFSKEDITRSYQIQNDKIEVIYNAANTSYQPLSSEEKTEVRKAFNNGKPYLLFVGSLHPRKNIHRLIESFSLIENPNFDLLIVGSKMWKNQDFEIAQKNNSSIHFLGYLSARELTKIMGAATSLVYVPYFEGFGIPLVEAMACGIPIIAANATCLPEIAGDAAIYCDPFDIQSIKKAIDTLLNDEQLQEELSKKAAERSKLFNWDKAAEKVWTVIDKVFSESI